MGSPFYGVTLQLDEITCSGLNAAPVSGKATIIKPSSALQAEAKEDLTDAQVQITFNNKNLPGYDYKDGKPADDIADFRHLKAGMQILAHVTPSQYDDLLKIHHCEILQEAQPLTNPENSQPGFEP